MKKLLLITLLTFGASQVMAGYNPAFGYKPALLKCSSGYDQVTTVISPPTCYGGLGDPNRYCTKAKTHTTCVHN